MAEYKRSRLHREREDLDDQIEAYDTFIENAKVWTMGFMSDWARAGGARSARDAGDEETYFH